MENRVIVITGASSGIGAALATLVASQGASTVLLARRGRELGEVAARAGQNALAVVTDVTRREQVDHALAQGLARFGKVDAWVNNAGRGISRSVVDLTDEDFDEMMLVNVKSALYGIQAVLPHFRERGAGHIINVSSMLGRVPMAPIRSAYAAAKHALNSLTANLRMELCAQPDIHVSSVHPGIVATEFGTRALHGGIDSRSFPHAQSAEQIAEIIADLLERPRADVYTSAGGQRMVVNYFAAEDMAAAEKQPPFTFPVSP